MNITNTRKKILLVGTCWYELTGLWYLLSAQGYDVYRVPLGYSCAQDGWDLIIVALSAESIAGWGRYLAQIREIRADMSGEMLVLVPKRLEKLKVLRNVCTVYSGYKHLSNLKAIVSMTLNKKMERTGNFRLTTGQKLALEHLSERGGDSSLNLKQSENGLYWHYARLIENVGIANFRMLLITELDVEILKIENLSCGN